MRIDYVITNPPYSGNGKSLYLKIAKMYANRAVFLMPDTWLDASIIDDGRMSKVYRSFLYSLGGIIADYKFCDRRMFDLPINSRIGLYYFDRDTKNPLSLDDIRFSCFDECDRGKFRSIFEKVRAGSHIGDYLVHGKKGTPLTNGICFSPIHGNFDLKDFPTIMAIGLRDKLPMAEVDKDFQLYRSFDSKEECLNFFDYCQTDFALFCSLIVKRSMNVAVSLHCIPELPDYKRQRSLDELCEMFGITEDEKKFIVEKTSDFGYYHGKNVNIKKRLDEKSYVV